MCIRDRHSGAFCGAVALTVVTHQIDAPRQPHSIDLDLDYVSFAHAAERTAGQRLRPHMADARARTYAAQARIGDQRHLFAPRQIL